MRKRFMKWLRDGVAMFFPQFARVSLDTLREDALYAAERSLLEAEFNAEHWNAHRNMLKARVGRLRQWQQAHALTVSVAPIDLGSLELFEQPYATRQ